MFREIWKKTCEKYQTLQLRRAFWLIFTLAVVLRFLWLGSLPLGLSWDEAAIGYNGYGIRVVRRDEWLVKLPVTFKSFGDYKAALAIYANAVTTFIFGNTPFAVRLPMAMAGVVTVVAAYAIALKLFGKREWALFAMLFTAVSPVNIHYSRIGFESGMGVALSAVAVACFLYAERYRWLYLFSAGSAAAALYAYHSPKISLPIILLILAVQQRKHLIQALPWVLASLVLGIVLVFPLARESLFGSAGERFYMTSAIADRNGVKPLPDLLTVLAQNTAAHLDPRFLLMGKTTTYRHGNAMFGILGYLEAIAAISSFFLLKDKKKRGSIFLLIGFTLAGLLPAIISNDVPHSNRAHGIVPWVQLLAAGGVGLWISSVSQKKRHLFTRVLIIFILLQTILYSFWYVRIYSGKPAAQEFQYGYEQVIKTAIAEEQNVDRVILTDRYGQPYIYVLFFKKLTPIQWQQGALSNYEFRHITWEEDKNRTRTLLVGTGEEIPPDAEHIILEVPYTDGSVAWRIVRLP